MSRLNLRKRPRVSYYEPEEPNLDEYVFCTECADFVYEYCSIHGPLLVIPDDKVPKKHSVPAIVPRAALTIPHVFLHLARSIIPGAGIGVFTTLTLPRGVRFGPYQGQRTGEITSMYCWQIYGNDNRAAYALDAGDPGRSNWMRYVNCSRHWCEQNLIAYQYRRQIYYRTTRIVPRFTELLVFYGSEFANMLGVDLKIYNSPSSFAEKLGSTKLKKSTPPRQNTIAPALTKKQENSATVKKSLTTTGNLEKSKELDTPNTVVKTHHEIYKDKLHIKTRNKFKHIAIKKTTVNAVPKYVDDINAINNNNNVLSVLSLAEGKTIDDVTSHNHVIPTDSVVSNVVDDNIVSRNILTCDICPFKTMTEKKLNSHLRAHAVDISFKCDKCNYKTLHSNSLQSHLRIHSGVKPYSCTVCKKAFSQQSNLQTHLRIHSGVKPYSCTVCNKAFSQQGSLKIHLRIHSGVKPYSCTVCNKAFTQQGYLKTHLRIHSDVKPYSCTVCNKAFSQQGSLKIHLRIHSGVKPYSCTVCNKAFSQQGSLKIHLRIHSGVKPYSCTVCNKAFTQQGYLKTHLRIHSDVKPYSCTVCNKAFSRQGDLKTHLRIHSGVKPYSCTVCKKAFRYQSNLKTHLRIHSGVKSFSCIICKKAFSRQSTLKIHLRIHSGVKPYSCTVCNKAFNQQGDLKTHLRIHSGVKPYSCIICNKAFSKQSNLKKHFRIHN